MFYNSTSETGQQLINFRQSAEAQAKIVLDYYRAHPGRLLGPSEVWIATGLEAKNVPLTNVRRAITDATPAILVKMTTKVTGYYGHPEGTWMYPAQTSMAA